MPDIACLGILVADLIGRPIDSLPPHGHLGLVEHMSLHMGGCASNTGIDLQRLGISAAVLGKVGMDGLGDFIRNTLQSNGIDTRAVIQDDQVSTSASMVIVDADGERTFLHHLGGNARYTEENIDWDIVRECRIFHVAGALVMPAFDGEPMARAMQKAKEMGKITSLDVVWDATGKWMKTLRFCLPYTDYFEPSLSEAQELTGLTDPREVARALRDAGVGTVALKMGSEGCYILGTEGEISVPAYHVEAVDGTGSGDAFDAGFLTGLYLGWDMERTARFSNAVGAFCVRAMGAIAGVTSREEIEIFMGNHPV
jgi:sugar/nucleoside kinase (ribokinase family)